MWYGKSIYCFLLGLFCLCNIAAYQHESESGLQELANTIWTNEATNGEVGSGSGPAAALDALLVVLNSRKLHRRQVPSTCPYCPYGYPCTTGCPPAPPPSPTPCPGSCINEVGVQGLPGPQGFPGPAGQPTILDFKGNACPGARGPPGTCLRGQPGPPGEPGNPGTCANSGSSSYSLHALYSTFTSYYSCPIRRSVSNNTMLIYIAIIHLTLIVAIVKVLEHTSNMFYYFILIEDSTNRDSCSIDYKF